ncbi:hypothetical protein Mapa_007600 [Marchantia paleacea]|nr:hypothetical protein Mapa_007600 [Marchantia paleacea]
MALYQRELDRSWSPPSGRRRYTKSGFGTQVHNTMPCHLLGNSRNLLTRILLKSSSQWVQGGSGRREEEPPGPGTYNRKSGLLTQFAPSRQRSPEGALFGTSTRKQRDEVYLSVEFDKAKYGTLSPGPSAYGARSTFGPQCSSPNRTAPLVGFIHDKRFKYHLMGRPGETTGPGQYEQKGSIGKQNEAYKDTLPAFSFGNCTRDNANKVFISMEHDKINYGIQSPGPAVIKLKGCMGKQPSSRNRNPAFVRFGKGLRWQFSANDAPGPGSYDC